MKVFHLNCGADFGGKSHDDVLPWEGVLTFLLLSKSPSFNIVIFVYREHSPLQSTHLPSCRDSPPPPPVDDGRGVVDTGPRSWPELTLPYKSPIVSQA